MSSTESSRRWFLGIDVGGTNTKAGVVDESGCVISSGSVLTEAVCGPEHGVQQIVKVVQLVLEEAGCSRTRLTAAGLATPGTMDIPGGVLLDPANLPGWKNFPIRARVAEAIGLPTVLQNDANAAAYGEYWAGSASGCRSLVFFTLGTGLGGGVIVDDHIIEGDHSHGSECGHTVIEMDNGRLCGTGQYGTAEAYCSAVALLKRFQEAVDAGSVSSVTARVNTETPLTPRLIAEEAEQGDALALELIMEMARCLGVAVTSAVHVIDPSMVLLGGGMTFGRHETRIGREFLHRVRQEFRSRTWTELAEKVRIDYAALGSQAGFIGAAGCARRAVDRGLLPTAG